MFCNGLFQTFESHAIPSVPGSCPPIMTDARLALLMQSQFSVEPVRLHTFPEDSVRPGSGLVPTLTSLTAMPP